jgi:branched-chain amino acid transport system ATP-binding protein
MLEITDLHVYYGEIHALKGISFHVAQGEIVTLLGNNGAGKTTTLRTVMGYLRPRAGTITFRGQRIDGRRTHEVAKLGLGWAPEDSGIFPDLTVAENIEIATWTRAGGRPAAERIGRAYEVFPVLRQYATRKGPQMSGGERKMLSIARALALDPEMLVLDEPFEGLSPAIVPVISESIATVTKLGHSILLAESNIHHVPEYADRLYVIERGEIIFGGAPEDAWRDASVSRIIGGPSR